MQAVRGRGMLRANTSGSISLELALVLPLLLLLIFAAIEYGLIMLAYAMLDSAVFTASRFGAAGLQCEEDANRTACINGIINDMVYPLIREEGLTTDITIYDRFEHIDLREPYDDSNKNGRHDDGEYFVDMNGNRVWDKGTVSTDADEDGKIVLYRVVYAWQLFTPMASTVFGEDGKVYLVSMAVARHDVF